MCHKNATCSDVVGGEDSYNCTCNSGYSGDGFSECVGEVTVINILHFHTLNALCVHSEWSNTIL